jgi:hypothetical protein
MGASQVLRLLVFVSVLATILVLGAGVASAGDTLVLDEDFCTTHADAGSTISFGSWDSSTKIGTGVGGVIEDGDVLEVPSGTTLIVDGNFTVWSSLVVNHGSILAGGRLALFSDSVFENYGSVTVGGIHFSFFSLGNEVGCCGSFNNHGSFVTSGRFSNWRGTFVNRCGSVFAAPEASEFPPVEEPCPWPMAMVDPASGIWHLRVSGAIDSFFYGNPGDIPFMSDWDCDGVDTPGLFRQSDAFAYLRNSNSQGIADIRFFFGNPSDVPLAGDFNGDGCDTLSIYRPSEARFYIMNKLGENEGGLGPADYSFLFGDLGDKPVVGDWDNDGIDEIGLHRETTGFFYYRNTLTTGVADGQFFFGDPGDRFVAGDWGIVDGTDTPAVFRPSNTTFYFRHTLSEGNADSQFTFGESSWLPVAGTFGL